MDLVRPRRIDLARELRFLAGDQDLKHLFWRVFHFIVHRTGDRHRAGRPWRLVVSRGFRPLDVSEKQ